MLYRKLDEWILQGGKPIAHIKKEINIFQFLKVIGWIIYCDMETIFLHT